jgi:antitoxin (DNA-binding transcriptional repressor) of toxin-antitoxin stability system
MQLYIVRMKRVTASEARRNWFRLLDEVVDGEVVVIERKGRRILLQREPRSRTSRHVTPDYSSIIRVPDAKDADSWTWAWPGPEEELHLEDDSTR